MSLAYLCDGNDCNARIIVDPSLIHVMPQGWVAMVVTQGEMIRRARILCPSCSKGYQAWELLNGKTFPAPKADERIVQARKVFDSLYVGGQTWEEMSEQRQNEYADKVEEMVAEGIIK